MNIEKVKEIKQALEQNDDNGIMYEVNDEKRTCKFIHHKDILTLIDELEGENERLKNSEIGELIKENEELAKQCVEWSELDFKKRNKITELKDRIADLEREMKKLAKAGKRVTEINEELSNAHKKIMEENKDLQENEFQKVLQDFRDRTYKVGKADGAKALAEAIIKHYPHTISIQNTVEKELLKYIKGLYET